MHFGGAIPARTFAIPSGDGGVRETLRVMVKLARQYKAHPLIRELARARVLGCHDDDELKSSALQEYIKAEVEYMSDVWNVETLQTPVVTLGYREPGFGSYEPGGTAAGDCDDQSVALAALLLSVGVPGCFTAIGLDGEPISHVLVEARIRRRKRVDYVPLETIVPESYPGWWPPGVTDFMFAHFD